MSNSFIIIDVNFKDSNVTTSELSKILGISSKGVEWQLKQLKDKGIIRRIGADKCCHLEINEN